MFIKKIAPAAALVGVLLEIFALPTWNYFFLAHFTLTFYLISLYEIKKIRSALWISLSVLMVAGFGGYTWITFVLREMGEFPLPLALLTHFGFNLISIPSIYIFFILGFICRNRVDRLPLLLRPLFWASFYTSLEILTYPFRIFPNTSGITQLPWLSISQIASVGGVISLSFIIAYSGSLLFYFVKNPKNKTIYCLLAIWLFVLAGLHFWGDNRIKKIQAWPQEKISIALVQANIGNPDKILAESGSINGLQKVFAEYSDLTSLAASKKPELILWPETAYPISFPTNSEHYAHPLSHGFAKQLFSETAKGKYSIFFGSYEHLGNYDYNSAILVGGDGIVQGSYKKNFLLAFGEYMPFAEYWPELKQLNPVLGDFAIGNGAKPVYWKRNDGSKIALGANVCYEALKPDFMRELALNGSEIFINFTNDSWFGEGREPYQHLQIAAFRTIENGLAMIRTTNTGISVVIDASGNILTQGPAHQTSVIYSQAPIYKQEITTMYKKHGELFSWFTIFLTIILCLYPDLNSSIFSIKK